jgi:hypothetical protein
MIFRCRRCCRHRWRSYLPEHEIDFLQAEDKISHVTRKRAKDYPDVALPLVLSRVIRSRRSRELIRGMN